MTPFLKLEEDLISLSSVKAWNYGQRKWTLFWYLSMLDQFSLMCADIKFLSQLVKKYPYTKHVHGHPCNGRWFQRFFLEFEEFCASCGEDTIVLPLALHLYYDDFGITDKKKCGGLYVSVANIDMESMHNKDYR